MRQGITTKYLGPTNSRGSRIKAIARKAMPSIDAKEMSLTVPYNYAGNTASRHAVAAKALAEKLGWSGLWIAGGKPEEDGNMYVNIARPESWGLMASSGSLGIEDEDWFFVSEAEVEA